MAYASVSENIFPFGKPQDRWEMPGSIQRVAGKLGLAFEPSMQDWSLEVCDATRVAEFIEAYRDDTFDDDDRFTTMALIIASLDDAVCAGWEIQDHLSRIAPILSADFQLHAYTLWHWYCDGVSERDVWHNITPAIRQMMGTIEIAIG